MISVWKLRQKTSNVVIVYQSPDIVPGSFCPYYRHIWGKCKDKDEGNLSSLGGTIAAKVTEPSKARKLFHEYDIIDIYTDDVWKRLDFVSSCQ